MYPILFNLGPLTIRSYGLFLVLAFIIGSYIVWKEGKRGGYNEEKLLDFAVVILAFSLIGARLYYILLNPGIFIEEPLKVVFLWEGGFAFHGALIGGVIGGYLYTKKVKWPFFQIADMSVIAVSLAAAVAKVGAFLAGADYGSTTSLPWGVHFIGQVGNRQPVQLYEAAYFLLVFFVLRGLDKRKQKSGGIFYFFLLLLGLGRWLFEFFRGDSTYLGGLKSAQIASLLLVVIGLIGLYYFSRRDWKTDLRIILVRWEKVKLPKLKIPKFK